jgi:alcohol dehydrogenase (cytochrome c)
VWRFNTIARPNQFGGDTWNDAPLDQRTGGSIWITPSYDPDLDLIYSGVGQTYRASILLEGKPGKPGYNDALFTNSTLALRSDTGELVWHYQHMAREVWDLDWVFERTLSTLNVDGKPRKTVTASGKMALFDTLDAVTGKYLFSYDAGIQNLVVGIDPKTGVKRIASELEPKADVIRTVCPSASGGGRNWPATSFNPRTNVLFIPSNETCMPYLYTPGTGSMDIAVFATPKVDGDGMVGRVQAVDLTTRKTLWIQRERAPHSSAVLATAGGLVFEGSRDRWFRALDDRTGKVLWKIRLNAPPSSYPISYSVNGVQYVAVTAGGGRTYDVNGGALTPEIQAPASGTTLWVFRLPPAKGAAP